MESNTLSYSKCTLCVLGVRAHVVQGPMQVPANTLRHTNYDNRWPHSKPTYCSVCRTPFSDDKVTRHVCQTMSLCHFVL